MAFCGKPLQVVAAIIDPQSRPAVQEHDRFGSAAGQAIEQLDVVGTRDEPLPNRYAVRRGNREGRLAGQALNACQTEDDDEARENEATKQMVRRAALLSVFGAVSILAWPLNGMGFLHRGPAVA